MVKVIQIRHTLPDWYVRYLRGQYLTERDYDADKIVAGEDTDVLKPDGKPLLLYRSQAIDEDICESARSPLRSAGSRWSEHWKLHSNVVGNWNCGESQFTRDNRSEWYRILNYLDAVDSAFCLHCPDQQAIQREVALRTRPDLVLAKSGFTSAQINLWDRTRTGRTKVHVDKGDLPQGFGVISVVQSRYSGGLLVFPKFRVAVEMRTGDVVFADVHEYHGNSDIESRNDYERIAVIAFYQTAMLGCR